MNETIKHRIEQIKRGEVPSGYKKTKAGIMPLDWCCNKEYQAKDIFKSVTNKKHNGEYEVLSATQDRGVIPRSQVDIEIKYDEANIAGYKKVDKCDFVISLRSFQGGIEYSEYEGLVSPAYTVLKPILPISVGFYKAYFKTDDYIQRLNIGTYGIRDGKQIGYEDFGNMIIHYPSLAEQKKIAEILATQDKVIALKEKLLEEKKKQKKYLMQQLLTGKKRLPGFSDKWKKVKLSDVCNSFSGGTPNREHAEYFGGNIPWIKSGELNQKDIYKTEERLTIKGVENSSAKVVNPNTLLIAMYGATAGAIATTHIKATINQAVLALVPKIDVNQTYLKECIANQIYIAVNRLTQGGQPNFNASIIGSFDILFPSVEEQNVIAEILSNANNEISIIQKSIDWEKKKKKALMQLLLTGIVRTV